MRVQTRLNDGHPLQSFGYTHGRIEIREDQPILVVRMEPRKNGKTFFSIYRSVKAVVAYELAHRNLDTITAIGVELKERFQLFWGYESPYWGRGVSEERVSPSPALAARTDQKAHPPLILNGFKAKKAYSSGVVEGLNRKLNRVTRKAVGFRSDEGLQTALFHTVGRLPETPHLPTDSADKAFLNVKFIETLRPDAPALYRRPVPRTRRTEAWGFKYNLSEK